MRKMIIVAVGLVAAVIGGVMAYFWISPSPQAAEITRDLGHVAPVVAGAAAVIAVLAARRRPRS